MWKGRQALYLIGVAAGFLAMSGYAEYDPATGWFDIHGFNLHEFAKDAIQTAGNALAALAVWRGWGRK